MRGYLYKNARSVRWSQLLLLTVLMASATYADDKLPLGLHRVTCDTQCQVDKLRVEVDELHNQVSLLQSQVEKSPKPISYYCKDMQTLVSTNGKSWSCGQYICQGSACLKQCATARDCINSAACNPNGECVPTR